MSGQQTPTEGRGRSSSGGASGGPGHDLLAERLGAVARTLQNETDVPATLEAIVHGAVGTIPGAEEASISMVASGREVNTCAATGALAVAADKAQYDAAQGPCLDSLYEHRTVVVADMAAEQRWPGFTTRAAELGVRSMLAVQLFVQGDDLGALNLFSSQLDAFDDDSEHVALLFAAHAAVAMAGAQQQQQLRTGMSRRDVIGQAKGMLMERYAIGADQAFELLARISQQENRKLYELAEQVLADRPQPGDVQRS